VNLWPVSHTKLRAYTNHVQSDMLKTRDNDQTTVGDIGTLNVILISQAIEPRSVTELLTVSEEDISHIPCTNA
jgi:hypothetical protein